MFVLISIRPLTDVSHKSVLLAYSSPLQISEREREEDIKREMKRVRKKKDCSRWRQMRVR